jgi:hypothetical protein
MNRNHWLSLICSLLREIFIGVAIKAANPSEHHLRQQRLKEHEGIDRFNRKIKKEFKQELQNES